MDFEIVLVLSLAGSYMLKCLVLEAKESHEGPFKLNNVFIFFPEQKTFDLKSGLGDITAEHIQQASLFDLIRLLFGVYRRDKTYSQIVFTPRTNWWVEAWTCPFCLSFWTTLFISLPAAAIFQFDLLLLPFYHFSIASLSTLIHGALNYALRL